MIHFKIRLLLTLLVVLALSILPLPGLISGFRPPWVLLFVLYIQFYMPNYFKLSFLFLIGLCLDVLLSTIIGEHALALLLTTWLATSKSRRFNFFPIGQQMLLILMFCLIYQFIIFLVDAFLGYYYPPLMVICSAMMSMILWPWVKLLTESLLNSGRVVKYE